MKKWTELEDKLILDSIPEDGVFTMEVALTLRRQLLDKSVSAIKAHWYSFLREKWLEDKRKEAEEKAIKSESLSLWRKFINLFKSK